MGLFDVGKGWSLVVWSWGLYNGVVKKTVAEDVKALWGSEQFKRGIILRHHPIKYKDKYCKVV